MITDYTSLHFTSTSPLLRFFFVFFCFLLFSTGCVAPATTVHLFRQSRANHFERVRSANRSKHCSHVSRFQWNGRRNRVYYRCLFVRLSTNGCKNHLDESIVRFRWNGRRNRVYYRSLFVQLSTNGCKDHLDELIVIASAFARS